MTDHRWSKLARVIADGVSVESGTRVSITLTDIDAFPAVEALVTEVASRGALSQVVLADERFDRSALLSDASTPELLRTVPAVEAEAMHWADAHIAVRGMVPPDAALDSIDNTRVAAQRSAKGHISTLRWKHTQWCVVRVPSTGWAELIGLTYDDLLDEFFAGCLVDWDTARSTWQRIAERLDSTEVVRVVGNGTDLTLPVTGRRWVVFAGKANLPDGELATAPHEHGVEGTLLIEGSLYFAGRRVSDLELEFHNGEVASIDASHGAGLARALIDTDAGSRRIGELGIGLNSSMTTLTQDLFFDEKIEGTVHVALGRAYTECGGVNESALHWDIVKDLRTGAAGGGGTLLIDDVAVIDNGQVRWERLN